MSKKKLLVIGAGGHAKACIDVIEKTEDYSIGGIIGQDFEVGREVLGYKVIGTNNDLPELRNRFDSSFIAIGQIKDYTIRKKIFSKLVELDFNLPSIISTQAYVSKYSKIGVGTIIMHHVVINAEVSIGDNCIINTKALIEHDVIVGSNSHISTGVILNGGVKVGENCFIGSGAILKNGIKVSDSSIVSLGSILVSDVKSNIFK